MGCCKICCGCVDCVAGQEGKCCCGPPPDGVCCQEGEYCCGGVCTTDACDVGACCTGTSCEVTIEADCAGTWLGPGTSCSPNPCAGSCCDGVYCSETAEGDCAGTWTSGASCDPNPCSDCTEDADCPGGYCCQGECTLTECPKRCEEWPISGCNSVSVCGSGAGFGDICDPSAPNPPTAPPIDCEAGTPDTVTVTGSGYVCDATCSGGDPVLAQFIEDQMNASWVVYFGCYADQDEPYLTYDTNSVQYDLTASVCLTSPRSASLTLRLGSTVLASISYSPSSESTITTSCGGTVYPCSLFSGSTANGDIAVT